MGVRRGAMGVKSETAHQGNPVCRSQRFHAHRLTSRASRSPEPTQGFPIRRLAQLLERALADLANALARDTHERADLLERHGLRALFEPVVQVKNLTLARGEILLEYAIDELAHQFVIGYFLDLRAVDAGEAFAEC